MSLGHHHRNCGILKMFTLQCASTAKFYIFFINTKKGNNLDDINFTINNARTVACVNKRNRFNNHKEVEGVNFIQILFEFSIFKMLQIFVN